MREDSRDYGDGNSLHWHDGRTCDGLPTLEKCAEIAIANQWIGQVLEREDVYATGVRVKCYSLIAGSFEHYAKQGSYMAEVKLVVVSDVDPVRAVLGALLDAVDYTTGACRPHELVGAVLSQVLIDRAREALRRR